MSTMITGGTGFLGSYLARHLVLEKDAGDIVLFDMFPQRSRVTEIEDRVTIVQGDVLEVHELLGTMKRHRVDRVVHLAAILGGPTPERIVPYLRVQSMGTANVFEACRIHGVDRVVFASSVAVHGYQPNLHPEVDEDTVPRPDSPYGICKLWGEHVADYYHRVHGLDVVSMRPTANFRLGGWIRGSYSTGLTPIPDVPIYVALPELAALGRPVVMPPDNLVADWMYAADAAEAWYLAFTVNNPVHRVFNMRSERCTMGEVPAYLRRVLPDADISVGTEPVNLFALMSNERLRDELGFRPRYTMETGMTDYLNRVRSREGLPPVAPS